MRTDQLTYTGHLVVEVCPTCQIRHAIPSDLDDRALEHTQKASDTIWVYCPNGHKWAYTGEPASTTLRAELDQAKADARWQASRRATAEIERRQAEERAAAALTETARTRKRLAGGACPCCNRTFTNLARHMSTKHGDYTDAPQMPAGFGSWSRQAAVVEVVRAAGEPLTAAQVFGRLVIAGRLRDTERQTENALRNAEHAGLLVRTAPMTWTLRS